MTFKNFFNMKYIDAEKLIHDLEERVYAYAKGYSNGDEYRKDAIETLLKDIQYQLSLQQEQPEEPLNENEQELVDIVTERMLKEGPIPTLKGKQKADFEKEFNRFKQIAGMINWPAREEIYKKIILWFMAWSADNLPNLGKPIDPEMDVQQEQADMGEVSDGYHTFNELYYYRMLYNAAFFNLLPKDLVHKSKRHHTGEECFGGGWFIVMANLPTGQISNHYELKDWDLFKVPEKEFADKWDGHTPQEAAERLHKYLQQEQSININTLTWKDINDLERIINNVHYEFRAGIGEKSFGEEVLERFLEEKGEDVQQEQPEVDLENEIELLKGDYEQVSVEWNNDFDYIARHFFELGLKAGKEE